MEKTELDIVCEKMDKLMIELLELLEEKIAITLELEKHMREGHIELAKARYIRGQSSVGLIRIPQDTTFSSLFNLELSYQQLDSNDEQSPSIPHFDVHMKNKGDDSDKPGVQDPVRWFGILVPQCLKNSQKRFQECVYLGTQIANIAAKIDGVQKDFEQCELEKEKLTNVEE